MTNETKYFDDTKPDLDTISAEMLSSFKDSLGKDWIKLRPNLEKQVQEVHESIRYIQILQERGELTEAAVHELLEYQQLNIKMLMLEYGGMKELAIETATNAAFKKVREAINRLVNFELL